MFVLIFFVRWQPNFATDAIGSACAVLNSFCHALMMSVGAISSNRLSRLVCSFFCWKTNNASF